MSKRRTAIGRCAVAISFVAPVLLAGTGSTLADTPHGVAAACPAHGPRTEDESQLFQENQVYGSIGVPRQGEVSPSKTSSADVYLISGDNFLQVGWYIGGGNTELPNTTVPRVFVGENDPQSAYMEDLRAFNTLQFGTYHRFRAQWDGSPGAYLFYFDGQLVAATLIQHAVGLTWEGAFAGEALFCGDPIDAYATEPHGSQTLQTGVNTQGGTGSYQYFNDHRYADAGGYAYTSSIINNVPHTDWGKGYRLM